MYKKKYSIGKKNRFYKKLYFIKIYRVFIYLCQYLYIYYVQYIFQMIYSRDQNKKLVYKNNKDLFKL